MDGDIWLILMILLPIIGIVLVMAFQKTKPSRNVRIAAAIIVGALFIAYLIWNYFFR